MFLQEWAPEECKDKKPRYLKVPGLEMTLNYGRAGLIAWFG